jgi:hypothetical protein
LGDQVKSQALTFSNFIYTDNYFLTTFDIWLLVNKYKIPTIFISTKYLLQTNYEKHIFVGYGDIEDNFCFILIPGLRAENIPGFKIIESDKNELFISLKNINNNECFERIQTAIETKISINEYLTNFTKPTLTIYKNKKPKRIIIEEDESVKNEKKEVTKKKKLIIEDTTPISPEKFVIKEKTKRKTKKAKNVVLKGTKKNLKPNLLIIDSNSTESV